MAPIFLAHPRKTQSSDEAGILITSTVLPRYIQGPYTPQLLPDHLKPPDQLLYVPPLAYFCVKSLLQDLDLIDLGGVARLVYHPTMHTGIFKGLIPFFDSETSDRDMRYVDPRVWGTLVQLYSSLPACFTTYTLPLSDTHLTFLQRIRSNANFTLITVLDLASCRGLNDETIGALKPLSNLCVLDTSGTNIGGWGVKKLAMCLVGRGVERRGPWRLRVWSLRGCRKVDDSVKDVMSRFPLLSAIDLRDTAVTHSSTLLGFDSRPPSSHDSFFHPSPPLSWLPALTDVFPQSHTFESRSQPHVIHINKLRHTLENPPSRSMFDKPTVGQQDLVAVLLPNGKQRLHTSHSLSEAARETEEGRRIMEETLRREAQYGDRWPHDREDSEGDASEGYSSDEYPQSEDMGPWDLAHQGEPYDDMSDDSEDASNPSDQLFGLLAELNEAAALVAARDAAEQEARSFYAASANEVLRLRGGALSASALPLVAQMPVVSAPPRFPPQREPSVEMSEESQHRLSKEDDPERNLMFFRTPPRFDSISNTSAEVVAPARKDSDKEVISAKRRKMSSNAAGPPKALLNRLGATLQDDPGSRGKDAASAVDPSTPVMLRTTPKDARGKGEPRNRAVASMSLNPFLAKKKVPSHRQSPTLGAALGLPSPSMAPSSVPRQGKTLPVPPSQVASSSRSATLPAMFAAATNKPRSTAMQPKLQDIRAAQPPPDKRRSSRGIRKQGFDLKAWATKTQK